MHSTGQDRRQVDFPGYDNAQRKGSDGFVQAGTANPWVPEGISYWEFGTDQRPGRKADDDYDARLTSVDPTERANSTFVFVTPRSWPGKVAWECPASAPVREPRPVEEERVDGPSSPVKERRGDNSPSQ